MKTIIGIEANKIRQKFIESFVNMEHEFYADRIQKMIPYSDGMYHESGYLWEIFKHPVVLTESQCLEYLKKHNDFYVMWDLNQFVRMWTTDETKWKKSEKWTYPRESILEFSAKELLAERQTLPWDEFIFFDKKRGNKGEHIISKLPWDLYIFDYSFKWTIAFTHETNSDGTKFYLLNEF